MSKMQTISDFLDKWAPKNPADRGAMAGDLGELSSASMGRLLRLEKLMPRILRRLESLLSEENGQCTVTEDVRKELKRWNRRSEEA